MQKRGGFLQIGEDEVSLFLATWPAMEEREKEGINEEVCGVLWSLLENWKNWNFWKLEILWLVKEGKENKRKEKEKNL